MAECMMCRQAEATDGKRTCAACRESFNEYERKRMKSLHADGRCVRCGARCASHLYKLQQQFYRYCDSCRVRQNELMKERYARARAEREKKNADVSD